MWQLDCKQGRPVHRSRMGRNSKTEHCLPGVCLSSIRALRPQMRDVDVAASLKQERPAQSVEVGEKIQD
jgi:hypothetical protein